MDTVTHPVKTSTPPASDPGAIELIEAVNDGLAGAGLAFISFLGAIAGLLHVVLVTIAAAVIVAIPMLVVGVLIGAVWGIVVLIARLGARAVSMFSAPERSSSARRPTRPGTRPSQLVSRDRRRESILVGAPAPIPFQFDRAVRLLRLDRRAGCKRPHATSTAVACAKQL